MLRIVQQVAPSRAGYSAAAARPDLGLLGRLVLNEALRRAAGDLHAQMCESGTNDESLAQEAPDDDRGAQ
ncbi:MAG: hypothetical protein HRU75_08760 [Planctomycetia bacterium]|nr:MAG: hypothetical protein HRU75_08760 [Planctomycetia bacterium]